MNGTNTIVGPGAGDAALLRLKGSRGALSLAIDGPGPARLGALDPYLAGASAVLEGALNVACSGATPIGITDCLNFGNPENPIIMDQFSRAIDGMARACSALGVPIVSGNVSLYNETDRRAILPTPTVAAVGLVRDERAIVTSFFKASGHDVFLLGAAGSDGLGGSEYVMRHTGRVAGPAPRIDLELEARLQNLLVELAEAELLSSAHDLAEGGLAVALAESATAVDDPHDMVGASIALDRITAAQLFGEAPTRVLVSTAPEKRAEMARRAEAAQVPLSRLGTTGGDKLIVKGPHGPAIDVALAELRHARETCLEPIVGN